MEEQAHQMRNTYDAIDIASKIKDIIDTLDTLSEKYYNAKARQIQNDKATQDILHIFELYSLDDEESLKLGEGLSNLRRLRRNAKNEEAILSYFIEWLNNHAEIRDGLKSLYENMVIEEEAINSTQVYFSKTDVLEEILGTENRVVEDLVNRANVIDVPTEKGGEGYRLYNEDKSEEVSRVTLQYPVIIYYEKGKKKSNTYYFVFPGIDTAFVPKTFASGDPTLNIHNKKLRARIQAELKESLIRHKFDLPTPLNIETLYPQSIALMYGIPKKCESRILFQNITAYQPV